MSASAFDTGTLSWVKDEIDIALERAGAALARYAAAPDQPAALDEARGHLHQAGGALVLVGLTGVTHCAETVEACLTDLAAPDSTLDVAVVAAAGAALAAVRRYLDELMAGHPDQPLRLYPAYRALVLAAGQPEPAPLALFAPDLSLRPPRREALTEASPVRLKALRMGFARGLAKWRSGEARGLTEMKNALSNLEQGLADPAQRMPWWIALGWFEALEAPGTADAGAVAGLLSGLDALFGRLVERPQDEAPDEALLKGMLYAVAIAPPGGTQLENVRAAFRLDDLIPAADAAVETRREACRAPLVTAMEEWERFAQGQAISLLRFHDVALLLSASARDSQDLELARLAEAVEGFATWLRQRPQRMDAALALELAGALVLIEEAVESEGRRSPTDEAMFAAAVARQIAHLEALKPADAQPEPLGRLPWRERQLQAQVAQAIAANLSQLEALLEPCADGRQAVVATAPALLHQVRGAFVMLDATAAAQVAELTEARLVTASGTRRADDFAIIANHLAALARVVEAWQHGAEDSALLSPLLDAARTTEPAAAVPVPVPTHEAVPAVAVPMHEAVPAVAVPMHEAVPAVAVPPAPTFAVPAEVDEMLGIFIEEAEEVLQALAASQPVLAANPADREALTALRRGFHTLKGSGRMVGLTDLGEAAYAVERLLNRHLDERAAADGETLAVIETGRSLFGQWVAALKQGVETPTGTALIARCRTLLNEAPAVPETSTLPAVPPAPTLTAPPKESSVMIGTLSLSPVLYQLYIDEAGSHVASLRAELAGAAALPSRELIRAAHTLAGISAGTGFPGVQALAHALENVLVRHSLAHAIPDESARMLIARATGALEGMVGAIRERRAPADEPTLAASLEALVPGAAPLAAPPPMLPLSPLAERRQSRPADEIDAQLAPLFLEEADEQLRQLDADLRAWRAAPHDGEVGRRMVRLLHTFKGAARMCGAMGIGELAHRMETRIEQALAGDGADESVLDGLDTSLGGAHRLVGELRAGSASETAAPATARSVPAEVAALPAAPAHLPPEGGPAVLLRVRADLIDRLVSQAGEMATTRSRIEGEVKAIKSGLLDLADNFVRLRGQLREFEIHAETSMQSRLGGTDAHQFDPLELDRFTRLQELTRMLAESVNDVATLQHALLRQVDGAGEALVIQSRQQREQSHALLRARMVPFATVDERLHRVVRQTAKELGRQANLDIRGGETPVDRNVLERMLGPLEHLLRNALAHGIEPPETRRAAGKPELGQIVLTIAAGDNDITLRLEDDGKGLDLAAIHQRALERGLLDSAAGADDANGAALAELIFRPGFSTAASVSEIAGRGVGLDVVRDEVTQLGGHVAVSGSSGQGTRFEIVLPLTLAVIPVLLVAAAGQAWAIPAALVEEAREIDADEAAARQAAGGLTRNGLRYPWHTLNEMYRLAPAAAPPTWQLLLRHAGEQIALAVEALTQNQEVVVKPLGDQLKHVPGLTGATVLPDGRVALIVNPVALAQRVATLDAAVLPAPTFSASAGKEVATVMVVDDSLTVRKITSRLLERAGYRVVTAKDGEDALEKIRAQIPAVILADIEMPRMDGFALVRALRDDAALAHLPVIMITSRIAQKHHQIATELGVRHYLGKPYDEAELLGLIAGMVKAAA